MRPLHRNFAFLALILLAGCAYLGVPKPETLNARVAVGYATVTGTRQTALTLLEARKISSDDAQNVQQQADNFRVGLDIVRSIASTDPQAAETKLQAILVGLNALDAYLKTKGAP